ncbi:MAG: Ig-like domain-containing protein [Bacilli bacterium]|jgi:uncharacterized protein YjdB
MRKIMLLFVCMFAFVLVGCLQTESIEATITIKDAAIEVEVGDFVSINPTITGATKGVQYISGNTNVFTVSNGIVQGVSVGNANLTIVVIGTQVTAIVNVTVIDPLPDETDNNKPDEQPVLDNYSIANGNVSIEVGEMLALQVLKGSNLYTGAVNWLSNNTSVVTVDTNGIITGVAAGNAKIIAIVNGVSVIIDVTVRAGTVVTILPTSLIISGSNFVNTSDSIVLTVSPDKGSITGALVWSSDDDTKATVNEFGIVTGISTGVVTITVVLADNLEVYGTFTLLVKEAETSASPITSITLSGANEVLVGNKAKLNVTYTPASEPATFTFSSSNTSIATVDANGWVMGVAGGSVQITASLVGDPDKKAIFNVTVIPLPAGITISGASTVSYGQNIILTAAAYPVGASSAVTWTSSDSTVATIDANGRVTGMKVGTATITATSIVSGSIKGTHQIQVTDQMSVTLNPTALNLTVGGTATITATVVAASLTDKSVSWSSSNTSVATVDSNGKVTAVAQGSANIIAKLNGNNSIQAQASVTVSAPALPTINISDTTLSLVAGTTKTLTATVTNASNTSVTWSSSATSVATVSSSGVVTGVAAGSATITATSVANTSVKATCAVTVTAAPSGTLSVSQSPTGAIEVGATGYQLYITDSGGASVSRLECTFTPSDATIATVSQYGTISALKAGTVTINVTHATKGTGSIVLTIGGGTTPPPTGSLTLTQDPSGTIPVGGAGYQIFVKDSGGTSVSRTECTFTTSDSSVATVSTYGTITASKAGSATITATHPSKGSGTITLTIGTDTPPITTPGTYTVTATLSTKSVGYGVTQGKYKATTKWTSAQATPVTQQVNVLHVDKATTKKIVVWRATPNKYGWQLATLTSSAVDYENKNPGWKVIAGINADFFDLGGTGAPPYQTMGATVSDGEFYKSAGNIVTIGFTNDGTINNMIAGGGTPDRKMVLTVGTQKFDVTGRNSAPAAGAISVFFGTWSDKTTFNPKAVSAGSAKLYVVAAGTNQAVLANSSVEFYGKGSVTSIPTSATLDKGQFGIVSNNATLNNLLAVGNTARVQWEYTGAMANVKSATGCRHAFINNNAIVTGLEADSLFSVRHPRTVIGKKADGTIVMVVVDGRQTRDGYQMYGMRVEEMQAMMAYYRCIEAYNLDGGGSSTMIIRTGTAYGNASAFTVTNSPNYNADTNTNTLRTNGNAILIVAPR